MKHVQVGIKTLTTSGFTSPRSASSYYPSAEASSHIHLGTSTSYIDGNEQHYAEDDNVFIMFVSFKWNGQNWFQLNLRGDGMFSFPNHVDPSRLPPDWSDALKGLYIIK